MKNSLYNANEPAQPKGSFTGFSKREHIAIEIYKQLINNHHKDTGRYNFDAAAQLSIEATNAFLDALNEYPYTPRGSRGTPDDPFKRNY